MLFFAGSTSVLFRMVETVVAYQRLSPGLDENPLCVMLGFSEIQDSPMSGSVIDT